MDAYFVEMLGRLKLTKKQKDDAKAKYNRVSKTLHEAFYTTKYDGSTKLLIGSYGKRTNIRPPRDVDLLFKIPADVFEHYDQLSGNGASALLQKIRLILGDEYDTSETPKAWGKVVLVKFGEGHHDVELLPAFEVGDGVYKIPNSEGEGGFEDFDVGSDLAVVSDSNRATGGVTRKLIKIVKRWKSLHSSLHIKSFELEAYVANFLSTHEYEDISWAGIVSGFFEWLKNQPNIIEDDTSTISTASARAVKALEYEKKDDTENASLEWRKVFKSAFPAYEPKKNVVHALNKSWPAESEEFIEDNYAVRINTDHEIKINAEVEAPKFRKYGLSQFLAAFSLLPKHAKVHFDVRSNIPEPVEYHWKVRNFGAQAAQFNNGLRGQIVNRGSRITESTLYQGNHYVEVYAIKDEKCVAKAIRFIPIGSGE